VQDNRESWWWSGLQVYARQHYSGRFESRLSSMSRSLEHWNSFSGKTISSGAREKKSMKLWWRQRHMLRRLARPGLGSCRWIGIPDLEPTSQRKRTRTEKRGKARASRYEKRVQHPWGERWCERRMETVLRLCKTPGGRGRSPPPSLKTLDVAEPVAGKFASPQTPRAGVRSLARRCPNVISC